MTFLEPLRIITEIIQQQIETAKAKGEDKPATESLSSQFAKAFAQGVVQGAAYNLLTFPLRAPSVFYPPTLKVCKSIPDLLIDPVYDPFGIMRTGLDLALHVTLPAAPHRICFEVPLKDVIEPVKEFLEDVLSFIPVVSIAQEIIKGAAPRQVLLRQLPSDSPEVRELSEHLKAMGVIREVHFRKVYSKELIEKFKQVRH